MQTHSIWNLQLSNWDKNDLLQSWFQLKPFNEVVEVKGDDYLYPDIGF